MIRAVPKGKLSLSTQPFSKRHGYQSSKEITTREEAPESLRHLVLEKLDEIGCSSRFVRDILCSVLHVRPDRGQWSSHRNEAEELAYGCEWFKFYDFVERINQELTAPSAFSFHDSHGLLQRAFNEFCIDEGIGWQMVNGEIVTRGTETFESSVHGAVDALDAAGRATASNEIHEALMDLSRRPEADLTGAIQHAMAALECVAREVCGDKKATLGDIIKRYPGTIPKPLDESVEKAWGYASEMARHLREGRTPERKEVELIVSLAATVATYLSR